MSAPAATRSRRSASWREAAEAADLVDEGAADATLDATDVDDGAPDLYVDGMRLRRDRVGHWVFPRSDEYPCVYTQRSSPAWAG